MFTLEDGLPPCICLHADLDLTCRSHQAQETSQRGCDHYENDPAQLVDLMALRRPNYYYGKQLAHCIVAKCMTARITSWTLDNCLKLLSLTVFIMG